MKNNIKLFCFPYAGGSANVYRKWDNKLSDNINIVPMELPGRGHRFAEKLEMNFSKIVNLLYDEILKELEEDSVYAFWGHSMGSIIEFYLVQKLISQKKCLPKHIFFSGQVPPEHMKKEYYYELPDKEFLQYLKSLGGMPEEILANKELRQLFLPIIRSDMIAINAATEKKRFVKIPIDITVLYGNQDKSVDIDVINEWENITDKKCELVEFTGNHFFIDEFEEDILALIQKKLEVY